jgi:hypothetical protein
MQPGLTISDCRKVLVASGIDLALIGGQAVSVWADEFKKELNLQEEPTSKDVDYWGDRQLLFGLAKKLATRATVPDMHMFTLLSGVIQIWDAGKLIKIDVLHSVPGVPDADWERITLVVQTKVGAVRVLEPVSLIGSKLHNLKNFDQTDRHDLKQLKLCIRIANFFLQDTLKRDVRKGLTYIKRLLEIACMGNNQGVIKEHNLKMFDAVPIETIRAMAGDESVAQDSRARLNNFLSIRWAELRERGLVTQAMTK